MTGMWDSGHDQHILVVNVYAVTSGLGIPMTIQGGYSANSYGVGARSSPTALDSGHTHHQPLWFDRATGQIHGGKGIVCA